MERDEIYLIDMWRVLLREWKWCLGVLLLTFAITYAYAHLVRRQWESTAWILIGQVGQVPAGQDPKAEPLQRVLERLQSRIFQDEVMHGLGISPEAPAAKLYRNSIKLDPLPYAGPMIRVALRADSPDRARQFAEATAARLHVVHQDMQAMPLALAHARLSEVQSELKDAMAERDRLVQEASKGVPSASVLLASKSDQILSLESQQSDLRARLSAAFTYETSMPWPVYVPERQAFPNPALTYGIGLLAGLGLGAFAAVARSAVRRRA